jgi:hypothetical protein
VRNGLDSVCEEWIGQYERGGKHDEEVEYGLDWTVRARRKIGADGVVYSRYNV